MQHLDVSGAVRHIYIYNVVRQLRVKGNVLAYMYYNCEQVCYTLYYTGCPTRYRTRYFFNNFNTNEDIAKKFEQEYVRCVRNEECVCSPLQISLQYAY
jgi:hypothetical protein